MSLDEMSLDETSLDETSGYPIEYSCVSAMIMFRCEYDVDVRAKRVNMCELTVHVRVKRV